MSLPGHYSIGNSIFFGLHLQAYALTEEICRNIDTAAKSVGDVDFSVVLRGDSTLRGHFPQASFLIFL